MEKGTINSQALFTKITPTRLHLFYLLQISGWLGLAVLTYLALTLWYTTSNFWANNIHTLSQSLLGLVLSLGLRKIFLLLWDKPIISRMSLGFSAILFVALIWNLGRLQLYFWIVLGGSTSPLAHSDWVFNKASIFFNFGTDGASAGEQYYYWGDVSLDDGLKRSGVYNDTDSTNNAKEKLDLAISFEQKHVDYKVTDFGGTFTMLVPDPAGGGGTVAKTTKPANAKSWAGTTMNGGGFFDGKIPVSLANSSITVWVKSPDVGIPVRLKIEDKDISLHTAEAEAITTKANIWEALTFDFKWVPADVIQAKYNKLWTEFGGWYFTSVLIFLCWSALYHGIKYAMLLQTERDEATGQAQQAKLLSLQASEAAKEAQLQMLRYQLNPHFMFNTLNAIYALIKLGDKDQAKEMVAKLSKFLRYPLDSDPCQLVSLSRELDVLNLYLDIEKVRFDERLVVKIDVEPSASLCLVPSLILQPLVENAIKYAVAGQEDGGIIEIDAVVKNSELILSVSDNGPGVELVGGKLPSPCGIGLHNTQQRLETLFGASHSFVLEQVKPQGLRIIMRLPYQKSH
jgi:cell division protein FtsB